MLQQELKQAVARAAMEHVPDGEIIGVGAGSTANCFIEELRACEKIRLWERACPRNINAIM